MSKENLQDLSLLTSAMRDARRLEEKWALAQAICARARPEIQAQLDRLRRQVIATYHSGSYGPRRGAYIKIRTIRKEIEKWEDIILTPELDQDSSLNGTILDRKTAMRLRQLLEMQHLAVHVTLRGHKWASPR